MDWHIGQRVVCVRDNWTNLISRQRTGGVPKAKEVYTIRGFNLWSPDNPIAGSGCGFYLEEIINPMCRYDDLVWREVSFDQMGFRPVKETDISVFKAMLSPMLQKA